MIHCGIVFYVIAQLLELVSKYFMWTTAKPKFKTTIIVGIVACVSFLLFVLCSKSLSQGLLIIWMCLSVFIYVVYFIMILINGSGEGASNPKPQISSAEDTEKAEDDTSEKAILSKSTHNTDSGEKPLSISSVENGNTPFNINKSEGLNDITKTNAKDESFTKIVFTVIGIAAVILIMILLASSDSCSNKREPAVSESPSNEKTEIDESQTADTLIDEEVYRAYEDASAQREEATETDLQDEGRQWLEGFANNINSKVPFDLSTSITCEECEYRASDQELILRVRLLEVAQYVDDTLYESYRMYFMTTFSEVPNLKEALQISNSTISVVLHNRGGDEVGSITYTASDI